MRSPLPRREPPEPEPAPGESANMSAATLQKCFGRRQIDGPAGNAGLVVRGAPVSESASACTLPTVVIVGAGAAGIFTAHQINKHWPGQFDVQLFEASPVIGGNVSSLTVDYGGQTYAIDAGAQFFYGKAQPKYVSLIHELGLDDRVALYPAGITIWESSTDQRRLWIPSTVGGFARYTLEDWKRLVDFGVFLTAAVLLNRVGQPDWTLSVDDWLKMVPLGDDFKQNVIKNFL